MRFLFILSIGVAQAEFAIVPEPAFKITREAFVVVKAKEEVSLWLDYKKARAQAQITGDALVVFVNCEPRVIQGAISTRNNSWSEGRAIYVCRAMGANIRYIELPYDATDAQIRQKMRAVFSMTPAQALMRVRSSGGC